MPRTYYYNVVYIIRNNIRYDISVEYYLGTSHARLILSFCRDYGGATEVHYKRRSRITAEDRKKKNITLHIRYYMGMYGHVIISIFEILYYTVLRH